MITYHVCMCMFMKSRDILWAVSYIFLVDHGTYPILDKNLEKNKVFTISDDNFLIVKVRNSGFGKWLGLGQAGLEPKAWARNRKKHSSPYMFMKTGDTLTNTPLPSILDNNLK